MHPVYTTFLSGSGSGFPALHPLFQYLRNTVLLLCHQEVIRCTTTTVYFSVAQVIGNRKLTESFYPKLQEQLPCLAWNSAPVVLLPYSWGRKHSSANAWDYLLGNCPLNCPTETGNIPQGTSLSNSLIILAQVKSAFTMSNTRLGPYGGRKHSLGNPTRLPYPFINHSYPWLGEQWSCPAWDRARQSSTSGAGSTPWKPHETIPL